MDPTEATEETGTNSQQVPPQADPAIEAEARRAGWRPKNEFLGNPNVWVDAETFVKRGREIAPHVARQAGELRRENATLREQLTAQQQQLEELRGQVNGLTQFRQDMDQQTRARMRAELLDEIQQARTDGDFRREAAAIDKLTSTPPVREQPPARPAAARTDTGGSANPSGGNPSNQQPARTQIPQEMTDWCAANPWYGQDPVITTAMNTIGADLRAQGRFVGMSLTEQLNATAKIVQERYMPPPTHGAPRVEGGARPSGDGSGSRPPAQNTWDSLPAHIKQACDDQGRRMGLIGKGKAFATQEDHRKEYARQYFRFDPSNGYDFRPPGN